MLVLNLKNKPEISPIKEVFLGFFSLIRFIGQDNLIICFTGIIKPSNDCRVRKSYLAARASVLLV